MEVWAIVAGLEFAGLARGLEFALGFWYLFGRVDSERRVVNKEPVRVPLEVFEGLEAVRVSGRVGMLDRYGVQRIAYQLGYHATVLWIEEHEAGYARGIVHGFAVEQQGSEDG